MAVGRYGGTMIHTSDDTRDALIGMVWQLAYRGTRRGKLILYTGGLSALEYAFDVLGYSDPYYVDEEDNACEVVGCHKWATAGDNWGDLYLRVCSKHLYNSRAGKPRPAIKAWALKREAQRDPITRTLPLPMEMEAG